MFSKKGDKMEKILEVSCNGLTNGGVQQVIMNIVRNLSNDFIFDVLVFTKEKEYFDDEFLSYGGNIFRIPHKSKKNGKEIDFYYRGIKIIIGTYKILKNNGPYRAIHCHNYFESALCIIAAKMAGVKIRIVHSHNDLSVVKYSKTRKMLQKVYKCIINKFATKKVGCSQAALKYLFGNRNDGIVINNAIDLEKFNVEKLSIEPTNSKGLRLLHVGNFSSQKNQTFLIEIAAKLKRNKFPFNLTLVGGKTPYLDIVKELIRKYELEKEINILPQDSNIPYEMYNADLFLFPSKYEGLGIVLIEAQAVGLHCLVSDAIPPEADLGNIEFIHSYLIDEWVDRIKELHLYKGKKKFVDMSTYDIKNIIKIYKNLYNEKI